jgi:hypothetical protein
VGSIYATAATKARNAAAANTVQGLILLAPLSSYRRYLQGNLVPASFAALAIAPAAGDQKWLIWEGGNPPEDGLSWITSHDDAALRTLIDPVAAPPGPEIDVATAGAPVLIMWSLADTLAPKVDHAEPVYDAVPVTAGSLPASAVLLELTDQGGAGYGPLHAREGHWFFRMDQTNAEAITTWIGGAVPAVGGNIVVVTSK